MQSMSSSCVTMARDVYWLKSADLRFPLYNQTCDANREILFLPECYFWVVIESIMVIRLSMLQASRTETRESLSDEDLVQRCWNELPSSKSSFDVLVKRHKDYIFRVALNKLEKVEDAEDSAPATFVRVFFELKQFRLESTFKSWMVFILRYFNNKSDTPTRSKLASPTT